LNVYIKYQTKLTTSFAKKNRALINHDFITLFYQVKKETVQYQDKAKHVKKQKTLNNTAVCDQATASDESGDIAIIQAATGCQVVKKTKLEALKAGNTDLVHQNYYFRIWS
jgi:hypothetical protein